MKKVVVIFLFLVLASLTIFLGFSTEKQYQPNTYYQVYLDGELLGTVNSEKELTDYMNKVQNSIIETYQVDEVFLPQGLEIKKIVSYEEKTMDIEKMYNLIQEKKSFTIEAKQITIYSEEKQKIYVLHESIYEKALEIVIATFVGERQYNAYKEGTQEDIEDVGTYINQIYIDNEMVIKDTKIPTNEKIYTDSEELARYLLYGTTTQHKKYISNIGDTIEEVAFKHKISVEELLLSNPQFKNSNYLLYPGLEIIIGALDPQIKITVEQEVVEDLQDTYNTIEHVDEELNIGIKKVIQEGENGVIRAKQLVKVVNGTTVYVQQVSKEQLKQPVDKIVVVGGKKVLGIGGDIWQWPTDSGWRITSGYSYRINPITGKRELHGALDIAGTGYGSNVYAANAGVIYRIAEDNVNGKYVVINHQNGYYSQYNHFSKFGEVEVGMAIEKGYVIGYIGMSGQATGPHLHFAVWYGGPPFRSGSRRVNPWTLYD